jgi:hypothetical protein
MSNLDYLQCRYDPRDNFGHKAQYEETKDGFNLYSYALLVCVIKDGEIELKNTESHSTTTRRNVREFVRQFAPHKETELNMMYKRHQRCRYW